MSRSVNLIFRMLLVVGLLLGPQADCMRAADTGTTSHAHVSGQACHDDAAPDSPPGHAAHDDAAADPDCPASHGCPTVTAVAAAPIARSAAPIFVDAPQATPGSFLSVTLPPDRRPPKG